MAIAGKGSLVKVGTTSMGTFTAVADLNDASMSISGDNIDITSFTAEYISRIQGLKDGTYDLSGFYNSGDTLGQTVIKDSLINDTPLFVQYLPDGTTGFQQEVKVSAFDISTTVSGAVELSITLEGNGAVSTV
jgi:predicted secreted protein